MLNARLLGLLGVIMHLMQMQTYCAVSTTPDAKGLYESSESIIFIEKQSIIDRRSINGSVAIERGAIFKGNSVVWPINIKPVGYWADNCSHYLIFLKRNSNGDLVPTNQYYFSIGVSDTNLEKSSIASYDAFVVWMSHRLSIEDNPSSAAMLAYLLSTSPGPRLNELWPKISANSSKNSLVQGSIGLIGVIVLGSEKLPFIPKIGDPQLDQNVDYLSAKEPFLRLLRGAFEVQLEKMSTYENINEYIEFAKKQGDSLSAAALSTIASKLTEDRLEVLLKYSFTEKPSLEYQYAYLRCLAYAVDQPALVPAYEKFQNNPEVVKLAVIKQLKAAGYNSESLKNLVK